MGESVEIREGTTNAIQMQLYSDGVAIDLTGYNHVEMKMIDAKNKVYAYGSTDSSAYVAIVTASSGIVSFTPPDSTVLLYNRQPYNLYWWLYSTATVKYSCPEADAAKIVVLKDY